MRLPTSLIKILLEKKTIVPEEKSLKDLNKGSSFNSSNKKRNNKKTINKLLKESNAMP